MAQTWIKMRTDLREDPAVYRLASELSIDRFAIVGRLHAFWSWWDENSRNGRCNGAVTAICDDITQMPGFGAALIAVKWLGEDAEGLYLPNFERHNGKAAKERGLSNKRVEAHRARNATGNGSVTPMKRRSNANTVAREDKLFSNKHPTVITGTPRSEAPRSPEPQRQTPAAEPAAPRAVHGERSALPDGITRPSDLLARAGGKPKRKPFEDDDTTADPPASPLPPSSEPGEGANP